MRVGLVIYGSLDTLSGGYLYDRKLVNHLRARGDQVEIVSLPWRSYAAHLSDNLSPRLFRRLRDLPVDVLIQDELNHPSLVALNRWLRPRVDYPLVSLIHLLRFTEPRPAWQQSFHRWVEKAYLTSVDAFIFNSQDSQKQVERLVGADRPSLIAYPAGDQLAATMEPESIIKRARESGPLRLLFLGNVIPRKGLHTLVETLDTLPRDDFRLYVVGSLTMAPAYVKQIRSQVETMGLQDVIHFEGPQYDADLRGYVEHCHLLVMPSFYEGFGIVYLEGMSFGLPAIATTAGAAGEIIQHGENGSLIPPGDAQTLKARLRHLHENRDALVAMSLSARRRFEAFPTWQESMASIRAFLVKVLEHWKN